MSRPLPPPIRPPRSIPPPVPIPISVRSLPSWPAPLNLPSVSTSVLRRLVSTSVALKTKLSPVGSTSLSGKIAMVGLPSIRRGSVDLVTRPSTVAPTGITVLPPNITGSVTRAEKGSPALELKVASVVSSFILTAVPVGREVCAAEKTVARNKLARTTSFFMEPPKVFVAPASPPVFPESLFPGCRNNSPEHFIERSTVLLSCAAIDVAHRPRPIDHECRGMRDVQRIGSERVMDPVVFGHGAILVQQKGRRDGVLLQKLCRLPYPVALFRCNKHKLRSRNLNFRLSRLELSHALHAVWSPGAAQKLKNCRAMLEEAAESEDAVAVGCGQRKVRSARPDLESFGAVLHVEFDFKRGERLGQ